jgi:Ca-activated chloride channel family protein
MRKQSALLMVGVCTVAGSAALLSMLYAGRAEATTFSAVSGRITQGALLVRDDTGEPKLECPLKHTDVRAEISGFIARTTVTQEFQNTSGAAIEAVYVFPLPHRAAVDGMDILVGSKAVKGVIKRREEARAIYEAARQSGKVAALLDQERPNIFTQSVANIMPKETVRVTITYVEYLKYEAGTYEWVFPMVIGPRYIPGQPAGTKIGGGWSVDTDQVPDASRITPLVAKPGTRAGHDISLAVKIDAGVPLQDLNVPTHAALIQRSGASMAEIKLRNEKEVPNKDFILRYDVAGKKIQDAVLTHRAGRGGFVTLMLQPPDKLNVQDVTPKEIVFVLDTSGSMQGFPIEKAKEAMRLAIDGLNPHDRFNLITFAGDTHVLFPAPLPATAENLSRAQSFLASRHGSGGTEMLKAIRTALAPPTESQRHVRIVCFMTDGYVGNEADIIGEIRKQAHARVFSFGIGSAVNRYLLDEMALAGRGEVEYVSLKDDGSAAARRFHERVRNPLLTDITIDWGGLPITDVLPARVADLFDAKPVFVTARYAAPARGTVKLRGNFAGSSVVREIDVNLPSTEPAHDVLATLWARTRVDTLQHQPEMRETITQLGLDYRIMTPFTSFVGVEETVVNIDGKPRRVEVPVEIPEGVSYDGIFGDAPQQVAMVNSYRHLRVAPAAGVVGGVPSGAAGGVIGGIVGSVPTAAPPPPPPATKEAPSVPPSGKIHGDLLDPGLRTARDGTVRVRIWLEKLDAASLAALKNAGFKLETELRTGKSVIGSVRPEHLQTLAKLASVRWIAPFVG